MHGTFSRTWTESADHLCGAFAVAFVLLAYPPVVPAAGEVYKSVDAEGHVVYSDRADSSVPQSLVRFEGAPGPPHALHFCWTNCFSLNLENGLYVRSDGSDETWTIERFTSTSVVLHRHDAPTSSNGSRADVTYRGQISNERLVNVTVNGNAVPDIRMAWGAALDTVPGSNVERDQESTRAANMATLSPADIDPGADAEVRTSEPPPPLADGEQPPCPTEGYLWTPGYWAWIREGYHWVPGTWVQPPRVGLLWTPGYWEFVGALYVFHPGYWGAHIGYYGGINYGFGYPGVGFAGGRWVGNSFAYNRAVNNVNLSVIHNTYNETVSNSASVNKVSYSGGPGGTTAVPTAQERAARTEPHIAPTSLRREIVRRAVRNAGLDATIATSTGEQSKVKVAQVPQNSAANPQGAAEKVPAPKPAAATPAKVPHHPNQ